MQPYPSFIQLVTNVSHLIGPGGFAQPKMLAFLQTIISLVVEKISPPRAKFDISFMRTIWI